MEQIILPFQPSLSLSQPSRYVALSFLWLTRESRCHSAAVAMDFEAFYSVSRKKWAPQTFSTDKCKHGPYWTKLSMHSPRSIWVIVAKFHTIPSYHLTDFQFLQIVVTDFSYRHDLLLLRTTHATYVTHDVILLINKMLSKEDRVLKGYGAKRIMTKYPGRNFSLASVKSGWLRGLGHFARASLPSTDPWRQPSERTTDCRMAPIWPEHH